MSQAKQIAATVMRNYSPHVKDATVDDGGDVRVLMAHDTPEELVLPRHISGVRLIVEREDAPSGGKSGKSPTSSSPSDAERKEALAFIEKRIEQGFAEAYKPLEAHLEDLEKRLAALEKKGAGEKSTG